MSLFESASLVVTPNGTKASKLYAVKPVDGSGDLTVTRATTATRVNSAGLIESVAVNVPRLDYSNGTCPSILVEPQRTNVFKNSEDFSNASFYKINTTITTNSIVSPDGNTTADLCSYTSSTNVLSTQGINSNNSDYTISIFAKKGTGNILRIRETFYFGISAVFNLDLGTVISGTGKIENYGNGWYRCSISKSYLNTQTIIEWSFDSNENINNLYLWGVQCEAGSYATSYIPTTSASVTRNADVISKTGISSLIGQTEGTMFFDLNLNSRISYNYIFLLTNFSKYISIFITNNTIRLEIVNSSTQVSIDFFNTNNGRFKIGVGYANNNVIYYVNGTLIGSDNSCTIPDTNQIDLTYNSANSIEYKTVALWKTRLSNSELSTLTTI